MEDMPMKTFTAKQLTDLLGDASCFRGELARWVEAEEAESEPDPDRRADLRKKFASYGLVWMPRDASRAEIDLLFGMAREAARLALSRRMKTFRVAYGIAVTCDGPDAVQARAPSI